MKPLIRLERHDLGPRLHVLGHRIHEWHGGLLIALLAGAAALVHAGMIPVTALGVLAVWLIAKDWRDLHPATRDTAAWAPMIHRRPDAPAPRPLTDRVPAVAAVATASVGMLNVASAMTTEMPERARAVLALAARSDVQLAHALALPAGLALTAAAWPLARRRRRAAHAAIVLLATLGALNLLKGLDVEEGAVSAALALMLWRSRAAFWVRHEPHELARGVRRAGALLAGAALAATALVAVAAPHADRPLALAQAPRNAVLMLVLDSRVGFHDPFVWLPLGLGILGVAVAGVAAATLLAPMRPRRIADAIGRQRAAALVRRHGNDTLSAFKLRRDIARRWSADGRAMAAYRIEAGALLLAGDPVGEPDAIPALLDDLIADARRHGLVLGCIGASEAFSAQAAAAGVHRLYLGDEAMVRTGPMALEGGARKSLRKAVNRVARNGYRAELAAVGELDPATRDALQQVSDHWRDGTAERGFSMAHDHLVDELLPDALVVLARDEDDAVRGFLHFAPVFGRPLASLGFMRRDRDTPNGLMDFLVVEAARLLGERGIEEFSLNFATAGRWLREPATPPEHVMAVVLRRADRFFQIERLLRFNAKFDPRWQPRYLLFERPLALPRVAFAAMLAEGQVPRPPALLRARRDEDDEALAAYGLAA